MEFVYVVPRRDLFPECTPHGFLPFGRGRACEDELVGRIRRHGFFVERERAERNPSWKQVIPYCVVVRDEEVLLLKRLAAGGEERLYDKLSIGVGGHVNPVDAEGAGTGPDRDPIPNALARELREELALEGAYEACAAGLLNDDTNAVGAVHVGLVQIVTVRGDVRIREKEVLEGELVPPARLRALLDGGANFETWSSLLVESFDELPLRARAALS